MADTTPYVRSYSFTNYQADVPDKPLPGDRLDIELDNIADRSKTLTDLVNSGFKVDANLGDIVTVADEIGKVVFVADNIGDVRAAAGVAPYVQTAIALFLGAFPEDPSTGTNGGPLTIGATYYNTVVSQSFVWTGSGWTPIAQVSIGGVLQGSLVVSGGSTTFNIGDFVSVTVALNGQVLRPGIDFTPASPDITIPGAVDGGEVTWFGILKGSITDAAAFVRQSILTTTATRYSNNSAGQPLNLTPSNHILFGAAPFAVLTYGVDYTVDAGDVVFSFTPDAGELYHVFSMPRFTNTEAQVLLQDYENRVRNDAGRAEAAAAEAVANGQFNPPTAAAGVFRPMVQRARDSVSALDLMTAGGLDSAVRNREATSADAGDITAAVQEALSACAAKRWRLDLPAGRFWFNDKLTANTPVSIIGAGMDATDLVWASASPAEGIAVNAGGVVAVTTIRDLTMRTGKVSQDYPITLDYSSLISGGIILPRAESHAKIQRVRTRGTGTFTTNGWKGGIKAISLLGLDLDSVRLNGVYTGAYGSMPQSEAGVWFGGAGSPVQLTMRASMVSAMQDAVYTEDAEGIYIHNNEFVTVGRGYRCVNAVNESGLVFTDNHVATVDKGIVLERMAEAIVRGNIFYTVNNVGPIDFVTVGTGCDDVVIDGNIFRRLGSVSVVRSVVVTAGDGIRVGDNLHDIGSTNTAISVTGGRAIVAPQTLESAANPPFINTTSPSQFETFRGFTGDLNNINTDWRTPRQIHTLGAGVVNAPGAWGATSGAIIETLSVDANTAWQIGRHPNVSSTVYNRRKTGGAWQAWV
ncbi:MULTISPECIES: hypothetical protein [Paracoccus]|uniref:hypothetical protein n=1 Tax=Paracoccus TaxID=265 RepID=UPI00086F0471|nr:MULTISPECIES: hypothetical protein [Paracoccus]ODT60982.1 MAG: hypothetical protein ABS73_03855 [Paracoccus sp. SCN 68-21]